MTAAACTYLTDEQVREFLSMDHKAGFIRWCGADFTQWSPRRHVEMVEFLELMAWVFQQIIEIRADAQIACRMTVAHNLLVALKEYTGFVEFARQHRVSKEEVKQREVALREIVTLARQGQWNWTGGGVNLVTGESIQMHIIAPVEQTRFDEGKALPETRYFFFLFNQLFLSV